MNTTTALKNQNQLRQMWNNFKSMNTPQQALEQVLMRNPQFADLRQMLASATPEQAFRAKAQQMGIDPDDFINQLKQFVG